MGFTFKILIFSFLLRERQRWVKREKEREKQRDRESKKKSLIEREKVLLILAFCTSR